MVKASVVPDPSAASPPPSAPATQGIRPRVVPFPEGSAWKWVYHNSVAHYIFFLAAVVFLSPILGVAGGFTAWRAAFKTARSHKFEYVVALKPQAAKKKLETNTLF